MTYSNDVYKTRKWYIAHEILYFETSRKRPSKLTVWENLILFKADNPEEAYQKALEHGRLNEGPVKVGDEDGNCRFKGLRDLVLIYDELEHGSELEWHELALNTADLDALVKPKKKLHAFNVGPPKRLSRK